MWAQTILMALPREISGVPPANRQRASETGIGRMIPRISFAAAASALVTCAAAGFLPPAAAGDMRTRHPRKSLAAAADIAVGVAGGSLRARVEG